MGSGLDSILRIGSGGEDDLWIGGFVGVVSVDWGPGVDSEVGSGSGPVVSERA